MKSNLDTEKGHDLTEREIVWLALSEFYLDTELSEQQIRSIAHELSGTSFDISQIKAINTFEVYPYLINNLKSVAGVWTAFNTSDLFRHCRLNYSKTDSLLFRGYYSLYVKIFPAISKKEWLYLEDLISEIRQS